MQLFHRKCQEHHVFFKLLNFIPGLKEQLENFNSKVDIHSIAAMVSFDPALILSKKKPVNSLQIQKGAAEARFDDATSLEPLMIEWLTPPGEYFNPPLFYHQKENRGFNHEVTGAQLCPADVDWSDTKQVVICFIIELKFSENT